MVLIVTRTPLQCGKDERMAEMVCIVTRTPLQCGKDERMAELVLTAPSTSTCFSEYMSTADFIAGWC